MKEYYSLTSHRKHRLSARPGWLCLIASFQDLFVLDFVFEWLSSFSWHFGSNVPWSALCRHCLRNSRGLQLSRILLYLVTFDFEHLVYKSFERFWVRCARCSIRWSHKTSNSCYLAFQLAGSYEFLCHDEPRSWCAHQLGCSRHGAWLTSLVDCWLQVTASSFHCVTSSEPLEWCFKHRRVVGHSPSSKVRGSSFVFPKCRMCSERHPKPQRIATAGKQSVNPENSRRGCSETD